MEGGRVALGQAVALPLSRDDVDDDGLFEVPDVLEHLHELRDVVAVDRAHVLVAQVGEEVLLVEEGLHRPLPPVDKGVEPLPDDGDRGDHVVEALPEVLVDGGRGKPAQVAGHRPDVRPDRHLVVVEHDDQVLPDLACVAEGLEGHAAGEGSVADHGDDLALGVAPKLLAEKQAQGRRKRGRGVSRVERVVGAFAPFRETAHPVPTPQRGKILPAAGDDLVRVALVTDVPDDLVAGGFEYPVQGQGQLHHAEVRRQVAAVLRDDPDDVAPDLGGEAVELAVGEPFDVLGRIDVLQYRIGFHRLVPHSAKPIAGAGRKPA